MFICLSLFFDLCQISLRNSRFSLLLAARLGTFLQETKRPQRRGARRNGCIRRLVSHVNRAEWYKSSCLVVPLFWCLEADKQYLLSMKHREERTWVQAYLDQEKHILRHMQGEETMGHYRVPSSEFKCEASDRFFILVQMKLIFSRTRKFPT